MKNSAEHIVENLIPRYRSGEIDETDRQLVDQWVEQEDANRVLFKELEKTWDLAGNITPTKVDLPLIDLDEEWEFQKNLSGIADEEDLKIDQTGGSWMRIAASISAIVLLSFAVYFFVIRSKTTYYAEADTQEVVFEDGTEVTLNTGSEIRYKRNYNKKARSLLTLP